MSLHSPKLFRQIVKQSIKLFLTGCDSSFLLRDEVLIKGGERIVINDNFDCI